MCATGAEESNKIFLLSSVVLSMRNMAQEDYHTYASKPWRANYIDTLGDAGEAKFIGAAKLSGCPP